MAYKKNFLGYNIWIKTGAKNAEGIRVGVETIRIMANFDGEVVNVECGPRKALVLLEYFRTVPDGQKFFHTGDGALGTDKLFKAP